MFRHKSWRIRLSAEVVKEHRIAYETRNKFNERIIYEHKVWVNYMRELILRALIPEGDRGGSMLNLKERKHYAACYERSYNNVL